MRKTVTFFLAAALLGGICSFAAPEAAFAHGGQIETGEGGARGPVKLSAEQQEAIALKTEAAGMRPLAELLNINGEAVVPPDSQADVSTRVSGQIQAIHAGLGDTVKAGQPLAKIEGRIVGNASITITAPIDGIIDQRNAIIGQAVDPGAMLFHISDRSKMIVEGKVYEEDLGKVKTGQEARIHFLAWPGETMTGKVELIEPDLDSLSRTVKVRIALDNPQNRIRPHMFARVGIVLRENKTALAVPNGAIIEANDEKFVFVKEGNEFRRIEIKTGAMDDQYSEVTDGLVPGDVVVTQGNREVYTMWLTGGQMKQGDED